MENENENENENKLLKELERIKLFLKHNKILILIILILTLVFMNYLYDKQNINKILKGGSLLENLETICENENMTGSLKIIGCYLCGYNILKNITEKFDSNVSDNKLIVAGKTIIIHMGWIFRAFIFRPIYGAFMILVVLFAITGSFIFPFLIFGILLYYLIKTLLTKYSKTKFNINKNNKNNNNNI